MTTTIKARSVPRRRSVSFSSALLLLAAAFAGCERTGPSRGIYGNGRIEGNEVRVAAKIPGRIRRLPFREGDRVEEGDLLVELASAEWELRHRQARAEVEASAAALRQAEARFAVLEHHTEMAEVEFERMRALYEAGAASAQQRDDADNAFREMQGQLRGARAQVELAGARLQVARAGAAVAEMNVSENRVVCPLNGLVLLRLAEEGEVIQPGQPLYILVDPNDLYLKVYIAERDIGKVRLGSPATVTIDAFPGRPFEGVVSEVAQQAEFTPKDIHMPDERTRLVFGVKIRLENQEGYMKPGMLADAEILWQQPTRANEE